MCQGSGQDGAHGEGEGTIKTRRKEGEAEQGEQPRTGFRPGWCIW